ncbi:MAG TPA: pyridoxal-phosphate dependent enzyme [Vicinamibacterales bacterium]|nr:pyridoxal-phosphate dependent enzyme [Vicinamibacterales bacterium]
MSLDSSVAPMPLDAAALARAIGRTPLVRLRRFEPRDGVEIYAKLESRNPGGSVKDRAALAMVVAGERAGALRPGRVLIDASSGNTGIAYAMLGAARGHRVRLCIPANVTPERKRLLQALGADLVLTDPMQGTDGAIVEVRRIYAGAPHLYFYPDQYSNDANWRAHYETTAVEILEQTGDRITHFVAGLGTSGTFMGIGRRLREARRSIVLASAQPDSPWHGLEGLKHMASAIVPAIYDPALADTSIGVDTEKALSLTRRLAREEGLFVGPSSGAALAASLQVAHDLRQGVIVTVFPDGGDRYASEPWWDETDTPALAIRPSAREAIAAHAEAGYPHECCGALIGAAPGAVDEALRLDNVTSDERRRRFLVSPEAYRFAEAHADRLGQTLLGFYHSHPDHPAEPSAFDLDHAWPNFSYVIASVRDGRFSEMRSWRLRADRSAFDEERLDAQPDTVTPDSPILGDPIGDFPITHLPDYR